MSAGPRHHPVSERLLPSHRHHRCHALPATVIRCPVVLACSRRSSPAAAVLHLHGALLCLRWSAPLNGPTATATNPLVSRSSRSCPCLRYPRHRNPRALIRDKRLDVGLV
ncbi:uncharacterized protein LOC122016774 [Zingiber officinale]|uniref:uncharacterized protein LOC122016774 n=1 Tax=Zingiber officinale TaxID=94328 RepID=UPI001C4D56FC|nr:uncharacterized protein LOC122016774 [Zingiber officinale]